MTAEIVVAGGGVAALELVLALRELAGDRVRVTVVAPEPDFVLRPMLAAAPLGQGPARRRPLSRIAADLGFRLVPAAVAAVDAAGRRIVLQSGDTLHYDVLVLAPGAHTTPAFDGVIEVGHADSASELGVMRDEIRRRALDTVAFVAPTLTGWLLPLYEAALITAGISDWTKVFVITPEARPLELFGVEASAIVARALDDAGIEFIGTEQAEVRHGIVVLGRGTGGSLAVDRIVSLPLVRGPHIDGVPTTGAFGLIPVDAYGRVDGLADVYAAGDATDFPVKQGGIACQQAQVVAAHIAARQGAAVTPVPFQPVLGAMLLTGDSPPLALGPAAEHWRPGKIPGRYLAPYLLADVDIPQQTTG